MNRWNLKISIKYHLHYLAPQNEIFRYKSKKKYMQDLYEENSKSEQSWPVWLIGRASPPNTKGSTHSQGHIATVFPPK